MLSKVSLNRRSKRQEVRNGRKELNRKLNTRKDQLAKGIKAKAKLVVKNHSETRKEDPKAIRIKEIKDRKNDDKDSDCEC